MPPRTRTTSTSFSLVVMSFSLSAHVRDADGVDRVLLVAILLDVLIVHRDHAGEADQLPARLVAIAAVDRVGEHALHDVLVQRGEENARGRPVSKATLPARRPRRNSSRWLSVILSKLLPWVLTQNALAAAMPARYRAGGVSGS